VTLSHCHTNAVTLSHWRCHAVTLSRCHAVTLYTVMLPLSHCQTVTLSHCHADAVMLSRCHAVVMSHCYTVTLSRCHAVVMSYCHAVMLSNWSHYHSVNCHCQKIASTQCLSQWRNPRHFWHKNYLAAQIYGLLGTVCELWTDCDKIFGNVNYVPGINYVVSDALGLNLSESGALHSIQGGEMCSCFVCSLCNRSNPPLWPNWSTRAF